MAFVTSKRNYKFKSRLINILTLSLGVVYLSACTFFDDRSGAISREEYLGWYCEADIDVSDQWHCSKRLLRGALPIETLDKQPKDKQPIAKGQPAEKNLSEPAPQITLEQPAEPTVNKSLDTNFNSDFNISADGYTVQLGAYLSRAMAEKSAGNIVTDNGQLIVQSIMLDGQYRFVIVYGQHQNREQAQVSVERLTALNPQLEYWVRSIKSLRNSH